MSRHDSDLESIRAVDGELVGVEFGRSFRITAAQWRGWLSRQRHAIDEMRDIGTDHWIARSWNRGRALDDVERLARELGWETK